MTSSDPSRAHQCVRPAWLFETVGQIQAAGGDFLSYPGELDVFLNELAAHLPSPWGPVEGLLQRGLIADARRGLRALKRRGCMHAAPMPVEKAADLLRQEYGKHWTLDALSHSVGRHRTLLTCEFRRMYGCSIHTFLTNARIRAAKRLLAETNWKTEAVALAVGYSSRRTFHRQFCRACAMTPATFRRRQSHATPNQHKNSPN